MIPRKKRFTVALFNRVFARSRRMYARGCLFLVGKKRGEPHFSVVVGKKVSKKAVERNRLRRQLYELIRTRYMERNTQWDIVFLYKGGTVLSDTVAIENAFNDIFLELEKSL